MSDDPKFRTKEDIERAVRAVATEFNTGTVFIIGSQAILMSWPDAPDTMRGTLGRCVSGERKRERLLICEGWARPDPYPAPPARSCTRLIRAPSALRRSSMRS